MTRPNAWALALVPPLAALILQRARPLFARPMIIAAIVVVIACVPFYVSNLGAMKDGNLLPNTVTFMSMAIHEQLPVAAMLVLGPLLSIPAFCGFWLKAGQPLLRRQKIEVFWAVMLSGLAAIAIFTIAIPSALDYNRFLYATLFPALAFAAAGIEGVFSGPWIRWSPFAKSLATAAFVAIIGSMGMMGAPRPVHSVFTRAARLFLEDPNLTSPVVLISSDGESGEGRFIAEIVAQQGECCRYFVERATQQLAVSNWDGTIYSLRYRTVEELRSRLNADRIGLIVVNNTTGRTPDPHHALLNRLVACSPDWREVARVQNATPDEHTQEEVIFYKNKQLFGQKPDRIRINLSRKIGRQLEVVP